MGGADFGFNAGTGSAISLQGHRGAECGKRLGCPSAGRIEPAPLGFKQQTSQGRRARPVQARRPQASREAFNASLKRFHIWTHRRRRRDRDFRQAPSSLPSSSASPSISSEPRKTTTLHTCRKAAAANKTPSPPPSPHDPVDWISPGPAPCARLASGATHRYMLPTLRQHRSHRLAAQDVALSRRKQGFESPWERQ